MNRYIREIIICQQVGEIAGGEGDGEGEKWRRRKQGSEKWARRKRRNKEVAVLGGAAELATERDRVILGVDTGGIRDGPHIQVAPA